VGENSGGLSLHCLKLSFEFNISVDAFMAKKKREKSRHAIYQTSITRDFTTIEIVYTIIVEHIKIMVCDTIL